MSGRPPCEHELAEIDTASHFDGLCPLCQAERIGELAADLEDLKLGLAAITDPTIDDIEELQNMAREFLGWPAVKRGGTVSVELLNIERETADRLRADNHRLRTALRQITEIELEEYGPDYAEIEQAQIIAAAALAPA